MKYLLLFSILLIYGFQCYSTLKYDGSERYRLKGTVVDEQGLPLKDIPVDLYGILLYEGYDYEYDGMKIISTTTGKDGKFEFVFSDCDAKGFTLFINNFNEDHYYAHQNQPDSGYQEKAVFFTWKAFSDFNLEVSENLVLKKAVSLNFKCPENPASNRYYIRLEHPQFINLNIDQNISVHRYISYNCSGKKTIYMPVNELVKFRVSWMDGSYADSIFVGESPVGYTLKQ